MNVETLNDWNAIIEGCGCCPMPACPIPTISLSAVSLDDMDICGWLTTTGVVASGAFRTFTWTEPVFWQKKEFIEDWTYTHPTEGEKSYHRETADEYSFNETFEQCQFARTVDITEGGFTFSPTRVTQSEMLTGDTSGFNFTKTIVALDPSYDFLEVEQTIYSQPITNFQSYLMTQAETIFTNRGGLAASNSSQWATLEHLQTVGSGLEEKPIVIRWIKTGYQWSVPDEWQGSYFKVTWDVLEEPDGWDDPSPTVFRSFVAEGLTWVWTGPGDTEDPDSWKSGVYTIEPPTVPGTRRVVNVRFECYKSAKFGVRPQVTGEAVEL